MIKQEISAVGPKVTKEQVWRALGSAPKNTLPDQLLGVPKKNIANTLHRAERTLYTAQGPAADSKLADLGRVRGALALVSLAEKAATRKLQPDDMSPYRNFALALLPNHHPAKRLDFILNLMAATIFLLPVALICQYFLGREIDKKLLEIVPSLLPQARAELKKIRPTVEKLTQFVSPKEEATVEARKFLDLVHDKTYQVKESNPKLSLSEAAAQALVAVATELKTRPREIAKSSFPLVEQFVDLAALPLDQLAAKERDLALAAPELIAGLTKPFRLDWADKFVTDLGGSLHPWRQNPWLKPLIEAKIRPFAKELPHLLTAILDIIPASGQQFLQEFDNFTQKTK